MALLRSCDFEHHSPLYLPQQHPTRYIFNLDVKLRVKPNITQTTSQVINLTAAQLRGVDTHPSEIKWHRQRVDYKSQSSLFSKRSRDYINNVWYPVDTALVRQVCGAAAFRVDDE